MDLSSIKVKVTADTSEAESGLTRVKEKGEKLNSLGNKLTIGLTTPIVGFGTACLMASSNVSEMESKFDTVFKKTSKSVNKWSKDYANAIGRSKYEIMEAVSTQADLMIGMGMTEEVAGSLAEKYTELAYDLASFNNVNDKQAVDAMTKAMMGEVESAKMLGVNLTETVMANSKFVKSTGKAWNEMTMAEKATARYYEAVNQSVNAIGDAEKTQGSFTNQLKRLKGNLNEISVELGKVLLPIFEKVTTAINEMLTKVLEFTKENPKIVQAIVVLGGALATIGPSLKVVGKLMTLLGGMSISLPVVGALATAIGTLGVAFLGTNKEAQSFIEKLPNKINAIINKVINTISENLPAILNKGSEILQKIIEGLMNGLPILLECIWSIISNLINTLSANLPQFMQFGFSIINKLVEGLQTVFPILLENVINIFTHLITLISENLPQFISKGAEILNSIITGLTNNLPQILSFMVGMLVKILNKIVENLPSFIDKGIDIINSLIAGLAEQAPTILSNLGELVVSLAGVIIESLPAFIEGGFSILSSLIAGLWNNKGKLIEIGTNLIIILFEAIGTALSVFLDIGKMIVDNIKEGISNSWNNFTSWLGEKVKNIPIIGNLFRIGNEGTEENGAIPIVAGTSFENNTREAGINLLDTWKGFAVATQSSYKANFKNKSANELKDILEEKEEKNFSLNIDTFINNREQDVKDLAEELEFYRKNYSVNYGKR